MTPTELADALEAQSIDHAPCDDCAVLREAAATLRALEEVARAASALQKARDARWRDVPDEWCSCEPCRAWDGRECDRLTALRSALARVGGGT